MDVVSASARRCAKRALCFNNRGALNKLLGSYLADALGISPCRSRKFWQDSGLPAVQGVVRRTAVDSNHAIPSKEALTQQSVVVDGDPLLLELVLGAVPLFS